MYVRDEKNLWEGQKFRGKERKRNASVVDTRRGIIGLLRQIIIRSTQCPSFLWLLVLPLYSLLYFKCLTRHLNSFTSFSVKVFVQVSITCETNTHDFLFLNVVWKKSRRMNWPIVEEWEQENESRRMRAGRDTNDQKNESENQRRWLLEEFPFFSTRDKMILCKRSCIFSKSFTENKCFLWTNREILPSDFCAGFIFGK